MGSTYHDSVRSGRPWVSCTLLQKIHKFHGKFVSKTYQVNIQIFKMPHSGIRFIFHWKSLFPIIISKSSSRNAVEKRTMFAQFKGNHKNEWHNLSTDVWISVCLQRVFVKLAKDVRIVCKLSQRYCVSLSRKSRSFPQIRHSFALCSYSCYLVITEKFPIFACHCT